MELKFTIPRVLFLVVFLLIFFAIGGFAMPEYARLGNESAKAWLGSILLFCGGAVCTTIVDHFVGNLERTNLRAVYVIIGVILMIVSALWVKAMHDPKEDSPDSVFNPDLTSLAIIRPVQSGW